MFLFYVLINILIVLIIISYYVTNLSNFSMYDVKKIKKENINTGDLFIVSYNHKTKYALFNSFIKSKFIHPSIALREGEKLYLIEYNNYFDQYEGLIKIPYEEWINFNKNGKIYVNHIESKDNKKDLSKEMNNWFEKNKKDVSKKINYMDYSWFRFINPMNNKYESTKENPNITCCEIICEILCELNIVEKNKSLQFYRPDSFINMKDFTFTKDYYLKDSYLLDM